MNQSNHHEQLTAHLMGVLGGVNDAPASADAMKETRHLISAGNSVVSSNSLSSSSTKSSSATTPSSAGSGPSSSLSSGLGMGMGMGGNMNYPVAAPPMTMEEKNINDPAAAAATPVNTAMLAPTMAPSASPAVAAPATVPGLDPMAMQMNAPPHPVAEFLFQLTKMLTDNNSEYIEWRNASIFVHDPPGLEKDILPKYFRHSNYSSFQRQMNYFGFRKIAGKGKMAPCSYVNEAAKEDISSLLFIKRKKTGVSSAAAKLMAQQNRINRSLGVAGLGFGGIGGGLGVGAGNNALMGGTIPMNNAAPQANTSFTFSNIPMFGGVPGNNFMSATGGAGNALSTGAGSGINEANNLLSSPQNMLAQLQQAHAAALMNNQIPNVNLTGNGGAGNPPQTAQTKTLNNTGLGVNNDGNTSNNTVLLTNDQGNVYTNSNNPTDWSNSADAAAAQSLFIQQATQGLSGNFSQAMGTGNGAGDSNGMVRLDSAANLRALINQQISLFNNPSAGDLASAMNALGAPLGAPMQSTGIVQPQGSVPQQVVGLNSLPAVNAVQGFDWNEMIQRMGGAGGMDNAAAGNASASLQQLLQGGGNGAPGPAPAGQPLNFNGLFGSG